MDLLQAFTLGLVQGVTEFLPISSSGFLILIPELFGWEVQDVAFDAVIHLATLMAVVVALWPDIAAVKKGKTRNTLLKWLALATVPVLIVGGIFEMTHFDPRSATVVAWSFIVWGIVLYLVDRRATSPRDTVEKVGITRAVWIGLAQAVALIPGTSRSGITITAGLHLGLSRETATRFSFLLGIPTIAIAGLVKLKDVADGSAAVDALPLLVGFITAGITAFLTIKVLLAFLRTHSYAELAIFRVILGVFILLM
ncbi:MAG: undecaprenyl-diphosphate phosphatase [Parcubacteria group bacterium]|nr:undecaprenyl-diphosphate phosphatase [Parcubacteria group bacterium]